MTTHGKNPFIVQASNGKEIPTAKLIIGNIPLSYSDEEIEGTLVKLGCKSHSKMLMERDLDERGVSFAGSLAEDFYASRFFPTLFHPDSRSDHTRQLCITLSRKRHVSSSQLPVADA